MGIPRGFGSNAGLFEKIGNLGLGWLPTEKHVWGISSCEDYSMITEQHVSSIIFAKMTEIIGIITPVKFVSQSVITGEQILRELVPVISILIYYRLQCSWKELWETDVYTPPVLGGAALF